MISFACPGCGRAFTVPEGYAGKRASCRTCGAAIVVPAIAPPEPLPAAAVAPRLPVRTRRLLAEQEQMKQAFAGSDVVSVVSATGNPPELYQIEYRVKGLEALRRKSPVFRETHRVEVQLTSDYPRLAPRCRMLTPVFHPNIDATTICVGDHWTAGERLTDLVVRIGEMLAYQAYNIKSPLNADAAMWADLNASALPTDPRPIRPTTTTTTG